MPEVVAYCLVSKTLHKSSQREKKERLHKTSNIRDFYTYRVTTLELLSFLQKLTSISKMHSHKYNDQNRNKLINSSQNHKTLHFYEPNIKTTKLDISAGERQRPKIVRRVITMLHRQNKQFFTIKHHTVVSFIFLKISANYIQLLL